MEPAKIETLCRKLEDGTTEEVAPRTVVEALSGTGTKGQVIGFTADNTIGVVSVGAGGTAADSVPTSRTINGHPLTEDITLTADDVGVAKSDHSHATITGTLPIANGGTGAANAAAGLSALGGAKKATSATISISTTWSGNTQKVTCNGVLADETAQEIHIMPKATSVAAYVSAGVYCSGQAANSLTFTCVTVPTAKLDVYVNIWPLK